MSDRDDRLREIRARVELADTMDLLIPVTEMHFLLSELDAAEKHILSLDESRIQLCAEAAIAEKRATEAEALHRKRDRLRSGGGR